MTTSKVYTAQGDIEDIEVTHEGRNVFRKITDSKVEIAISTMLLSNPHKNIVSIYAVTDFHIDMELLDINISDVDALTVKSVMTNVKNYLQELGIIYIDWKLDNIGIGSDGELKLFDFDSSGIIDVCTKEWKNEPPALYSYKKAVKNGMTNPIDIDNFAFTYLTK